MYWIFYCRWKETVKLFRFLLTSYSLIGTCSSMQISIFRWPAKHFVGGLRKFVCYFWGRRWQWPRGLRHHLFSPAGTLGLWARIPLKAWMSVCVYSLCFSVCRYRPSDGLIPRLRSPIDCILLLFTAIGFSPGGSSPYTSTHNTNGNKI
jgi:hypothetical protein